VKPFEPKELMARIKAVLRRYRNGNQTDLIVLPNLTINLSNYEVVYHGKKTDMPPKEFELLYFLASNPDKVFNREQLLEKIWGYDYPGDTRTVDVHIKRIRNKLDKEDSYYIATVWGVGYKFTKDER
jgi:DNA-binding response OmpR family regulator